MSWLLFGAWFTICKCICNRGLNWHCCQWSFVLGLFLESKRHFLPKKVINEALIQYRRAYRQVSIFSADISQIWIDMNAKSQQAGDDFFVSKVFENSSALKSLEKWWKFSSHIKVLATPPLSFYSYILYPAKSWLWS